MLFDTNNELQAQQGEAYYNKLRKEKKLVEITEKRVMPTRTSQQNKTVHMWFGVFADFTGNPSREETKEQVIRAILGRKPRFNPYTGKEEMVDYHTHEMTVDELSAFMDKFKIWALTEFGCYLPYFGDPGYEEMARMYNK